MRRVVVTGLGMVTPLGLGVMTNWNRLIAGESGITVIDRFDVSQMPSKVAGLVPRGDPAEGRYDPDQVVEPKEQRKNDDFIIYAIAAVAEAVTDSGWSPEDDESRERTGVMIGSGIGGLQWIAEGAVTLQPCASQRRGEGLPPLRPRPQRPQGGWRPPGLAPHCPALPLRRDWHGATCAG